LLENWVQRRKFGPNGGGRGLKEEWRKLQKEEIHNFYYSPNIPQ
jgi:hypothetical protein